MISFQSKFRARGCRPGLTPEATARPAEAGQEEEELFGGHPQDAQSSGRGKMQCDSEL